MSLAYPHVCAIESALPTLSAGQESVSSVWPKTVMPFDLIILSAQRKFLSRARCQTPLDVAQLLLKTLVNDVVGRVSIQRVIEKQSKVDGHSPG